MGVYYFALVLAASAVRAQDIRRRDSAGPQIISSMGASETKIALNGLACRLREERE